MRHLFEARLFPSRRRGACGRAMGADHFVFLSNEEEVLRELPALMAGLH
jgi:hypothetical protein